MRRCPVRYRLATAAVTAAVAVPGVDAAGAAAEASAPPGGLIAYEAHTPVPVIATVAGNGTGRRTLVDEAGSPAWSPDGRWLAYANHSDGTIWRVRSDGTGNRRIVASTSGLVDSPAWSPSGRRLAYTREWGVMVGGYPEERYAIYVARRDGSRVRRLSRVYRGSGWGSPTWSPDGRLIAYRTSGPSGGIAVIRPDGTQYRMLRARVHARNLMFAPTGRRLMFVHQPDNTGDVLAPSTVATLNLRTDKLREIPARTLGRGFTWNAVWTPDGARIAYLHQAWTPQLGSIPGAPMRLLTIHPDGSGRRRVIQLEGSIGGELSWRP